MCWMEFKWTQDSVIDAAHRGSLVTRPRSGKGGSPRSGKDGRVAHAPATQCVTAPADKNLALPTGSVVATCRPATDLATL